MTSAGNAHGSLFPRTAWLALVQPHMCQDEQVLSSKAAFQPVSCHHLLVPEVSPVLIQDHFLFSVFDGIPVGHKIYLACQNSFGSTSIWCISLSWFCTVCRLALCVFHATIQIINRTLSRTRCRINLWGTALGTGLHLDFVPVITTLSPVGQLVFSPPLCPLH